jgi:hypothetical protein
MMRFISAAYVGDEQAAEADRDDVECYPHEVGDPEAGLFLYNTDLV